MTNVLNSYRPYIL